MNNLAKAAWADVKKNRDFFFVQTQSGFRMSAADPKGKQFFLSPNISDAELGAAVLDALAHSRFIPPQEQPEEDLALFDYKLVQNRYVEWVKSAMQAYGYKSKRSLFQDMASCSIERREGSIEIRPTRHEELEGWSGDGIKDSDYVVVPSESSPIEVGAALKLAFTRCT